MGSPGENTEVCSVHAASISSPVPEALPQRTFPIQGPNLRLLCLPHWQVGSLPLSHLGSPHRGPEPGPVSTPLGCRAGVSATASGPSSPPWWGPGESGAGSLITAAFVSALLYPPRWMGLCCCQTGWTKPQAAKMTHLAAVSLIKADSFQRRTVSNLGDCNRKRKNKLESYFRG